jgi:hypothetical protein
VSYAGRVQDALHDVLESVMPDGAVVDWKMRSKVAEVVNTQALPFFEAEVRKQGVRRAVHVLEGLMLAQLEEIEDPVLPPFKRKAAP